MNNWDKSIKAITSAVDRTDYLYEKWAKKQGVNNYVSRIMYMLYLSGVNRQKEMVENYGMPKQEGINYANKIVTPLLDCEIRVLKKMGTQRVEMLIDTMNQYADLLETEMKTFYSK